MDLILLQPGNSDIVPGDLVTGNLDSGLPPEINPGSCIELVSFHYGMKQQMTTDVSNTARTSGRPTLSDITCVKYTDNSSAELYRHCLEGKPIDSGQQNPPTKIFVMRNEDPQDEGGGSLLVCTIELLNTMISSIECQSHPNDMPTEQFALNYTDIKWINSMQAGAGTAPGDNETSWSVAKNRPGN